MPFGLTNAPSTF
jgi:hypothetical protein